MNTVVETINTAGRAFVDFALPMLIQSSVLIVILLAADAILRRKVRAVFRYWIWMLVLVKLVLPPSLGSPVSVGTWLGDTLEVPTAALFEPEPPRAVEPEATQPHPTISAILSPPDPGIVQPVVPPISPAPAEVVRPIVPQTKAVVRPPVVSLNWQGLALLVWSAVVIALTLLLGQRAFFVRGLVGQAEEAGQSMLSELENCRMRFGLRGRIALRLSPNATSPAVCGLFRPVILIPQTLAPRLHSHDLQAVLLHELAHVKRGDLWINLVQTLLQIAYFYNPLLWLANAMIRRTREQAVDEAVLVAMGEAARQYPETLVNIAKLAFTRRPALSLRLIGVVESKSALTGRIRHILNHPLPKSAKLGLLGLLSVAIAAGVLLPMAGAAEEEATVEAGGPLDIRLVGVCPDGGEELYDADGKKLDSTLGLVGLGDYLWKSDEQRREFVLQVPASEGQLLFLPFPLLCPAGTNYRLGGFVNILNADDNSSSVIVSHTFPRVYRRTWARFFTHDVPIRKVDLTLQYFHGPRRDSICTFTGPFATGQVVQADDGRPYQLTPMEPNPGAESRIRFRLTTNQPFAHDVPVLLYDKQGRRHLVQRGGGHSDSGGANWTYETLAQTVPWDEVAALAIGEKPYEATFRNIVVEYRGRPPRTYPAHWDQIAQRLGSAGAAVKRLDRYEFKDAREAIAVLDLIRDPGHMQKALWAIEGSRPPVDFAGLDEATRERIRQTAEKWQQSPNMPARAVGVRLGLTAGFPEFVEPAFALLDYRHPTDSQQTHNLHNSVLTGLHYHMDKMKTEDIQWLKHLALRCDDGHLWSMLFQQCLDTAHRPAVSDVLWELAQDDRPWLWWPSLAELLERNDQRLKQYQDLPEPMQVRLALVVRGRMPGEDRLQSAIRTMLPGLFTVDTVRMYPQMWWELRTALTTYLDHREATAVYMDFLRTASQPAAIQRFETDHGSHNALYETASALLRDINLWYGVNLGQLGLAQLGETDETLSGPGALVQAVTEALDWYRANPEREPAEPVFEGRVVDSGGKPIIGATVTLHKEIIVPTGLLEGTVHEGGDSTAQTDTEGRFVFRDLLPVESHRLRLAVAAAGFADRVNIQVDQMPDGRFYFQAAPEKNGVIVLEKPAMLGGGVTRFDGKPLALAELSLNLHPTHGTSGNRRVRTDAQGRFNYGPVMSGSHLLRYGESVRRGDQGDYPGLTAVKLVRIEEGQTVDDVVLDLRESTAGLELEIVDGDSRPLGADRVSLNIGAPSTKPPHLWILSLEDVKPQPVHRVPNLPPMEGYLDVFVTGQPPRQVAIKLVPHETTRCRVEFASAVGRSDPMAAQSAPGAEGHDRIVLPAADRGPVVLDLATGELIPLPATGPEPQKVQQALRQMGKGDILYDVDLGDRTLIFLRDAKSEPAGEETGEPSVTGHLIGRQLPETLTVTTAEGRQYGIEVLSADDEACVLRYFRIPADRGGAGDLEGQKRIVLPEADRRPMVLDLLRSELIPLPPLGPEPRRVQQALRQMGKGDILYDVDLGDRTLIFLRDAKCEPAGEETGEPSVTGHLIGQQLPETLTVTTAEGRRYEITILSADEDGCTLNYSPLPLDQGAGGGALVEPDEAANGPKDTIDRKLFQVHGVVTDVSGRPMAEVEVNVDCGFEKPRRADRAFTDENGRYALEFKPAMYVADADSYGVGIQPAFVWTRKDGFYETSLRHKGNLALAGKKPGPEEQRFVADRAGVVLPHEPYELNFTMSPAARIEGTLVDAQDKPLAARMISLFSRQRYPSNRGFETVQTDWSGRFTVNDVPCASFFFICPSPSVARSGEITFARPGPWRLNLMYRETGQHAAELVVVDLQEPAGSSEAAAAWQDIGAAIPPDANDARTLAPGVVLDGIGQDVEGTMFASTLREIGATGDRQYRFRVHKKDGQVLEPQYYVSLEQAGGRLWEKFTFDMRYDDRGIDHLRLQSRRVERSQKLGIPVARDEIVAAAAGERSSPAKDAPPGRYALWFDGRDDYLFIPDSESLRTAASLTVEMWIKPQFPEGPYKHRPAWAVLARGAYTGTGRVQAQGFGIHMANFDPNENTVEFDHCEAADRAINAAATFMKLPPEWAHISETFSNEGHTAASGHPLVIGRFLIPTDDYLYGQIAEIRIWGAISRDDIRRYESKALTGAEPGLIACWTFEEGRGQVAHDISPNANHARLGSSVETDDADPRWASLDAEDSTEGRTADTQTAETAGGWSSEQAENTLKRLIDEASPGSTVTIPTGRYTTPIQVAKPLVLRGESQEGCVIEVIADQPAIWVNTGGKGDVTVENVTIRWQLATQNRVEQPFALHVKDTNAVIRNCRFAALGDSRCSPVGIQIEGRSKSTVENCRFSGFDYVVCYGLGTEGVVQDCVITDCGHQGVIAYDAATLTVQRCIIAGSKFHAVRCTGGTLTVKDNLLIKNANRGIYLGNKTGRGTITNNLIVGNGTGISGFGRADYVIANNTIVDNSFAGIDMRDSCRLSIRNNVLAKNQRGLALFKEGAQNFNTVAANAFWANATDTESLEKPADSVTADPQFADPNHGDFSVRGPVQEAGYGLTDPRIIERLWEKYEQLQQERPAEPALQAQAGAELGSRLPQFKEALFAGDSEARYKVLTTILSSRMPGILDDSFVPAMQAAGDDPDPRVRNDVARVAGHRWVWSAQQQDPNVIELMLKLSSDSDREVRYNAVYYGLSVVRDKNEPIVRRLVDLALADQEQNFYGRIVWGLESSAQTNRPSIERILTVKLEAATTEAERAVVRRLWQDVLKEEPSAMRDGSGRVVDPEGNPVIGAQVAVISARASVTIDGGRLLPLRFGKAETSPMVETDAQGRFRIEGEPNDGFALIAAHDAGFALVGSDAFMAQDVIRLEKWGRVEGQVAEGRRPLEDQIWMTGLPNETWLGYKRECLYEGRCDSQGRFAFSQVPPGWFEVGYLIKTGNSTSSRTSGVPVVVKPGETAQVMLGGEGRPVVGRFVPPSGYSGKVDFSEGLRALDTWRPGFPKPEDYEQMTVRQQQEWYRKWVNTPEGQAFYEPIWHDLNQRHYVFRIEDNGTFRIEDVIVGKYTMTVHLERELPDRNPPLEILGSYHGTIEVPPIPGGRTDEPLDLGELALEIRSPSSSSESL